MWSFCIKILRLVWKKYLCLYAKINTKIKLIGDLGHIHRPLMYHEILRKVNLSLIQRVNYVEEMVLKGSQKLHDLNLKKKRNVCGNRNCEGKIIWLCKIHCHIEDRKILQVLPMTFMIFYKRARVRTQTHTHTHTHTHTNTHTHIRRHTHTYKHTHT